MNDLPRRGPDRVDGAAPSRALVLLDLSMPKTERLPAGAEINADPGLRHIPGIVMTTSRAEEAISGCDDFGANALVTTLYPVEALGQVMTTIGHDGSETVERPEP